MTFLIGATLAASPVWAAGESERDAAEDGDPIIVKGQRIEADRSAWSSTTLDNDRIREEAPSTIDRLFRHVPGMAVRDLGLGGVANSIVIRGFGGGAHGGDLGVVIDGIPLNEAMSHADGYVDFNVIVPLEVDRLTVFKGPVSALYGNYNRGGLVRVDTRRGGEYLNFDAAIGSFATADLQAATGVRLGARQQLNLAAQLYLTGGFRPRSDNERQTVSARWSLDAGPAVRLSVAGRLHRADANSASYLTQAQFERDPRGIDPNVQNDGSRKDFATLRADVGVTISDAMSLVTFGYATFHDFTRWFSRPVGGGVWRQREETYDRRVLGAGSSLNGDFPVPWAASPLAYAVGVEGFREETDFQFFDGLLNRVRRSPAQSDRRTSLASLSAFAEVNAPVLPLLDGSLGLRADRFTGSCERLGPETGNDPCGTIDGISQLSPKFGLVLRALPWARLRSSWAQGFALPNNFIKYAVGAQDLDPNIFRQIEAGLNLSPVPGLVLDAALFRLDSTREIRTVAPGIFENFGRTRREGIEVSGEWSLADAISLRAVYGRHRTRVVENGDPRLIGKRVGGVPDYSATVSAAWSPIRDWSVEGEWRAVGSYAVDAFNTRFSNPYERFDLMVARTGRLPVPYRAYLRIDNVTDVRHATSELQIGGQRLVAPGTPRAVRAGVQITL